jgi:hypothetical protein
MLWFVSCHRDFYLVLWEREWKWQSEESQRILGFEYEMSPTGSCCQLVVLFWEVVETLGSRVEPEEVGHWGCAFEGYTWFPMPLLSLCILSTMSWRTPSTTNSWFSFYPSDWGQTHASTEPSTTQSKINLSSIKLFSQVFGHSDEKAN